MDSICGICIAGAITGLFVGLAIFFIEEDKQFGKILFGIAIASVVGLFLFC